MNIHLTCILSVLALLSHASHATDKPVPKKDTGGRYLASPLKGDYYMYGGSLGDKSPPSKNDRKLSVMLRGPVAKDLFDNIGPDTKNACSSGPAYREREKGDLSCIWTKDDGYSCYFGLDVRTGKSMRGIIC